MTRIPIPRTAADLVRTNARSAHPGLVLDKYVASYSPNETDKDRKWQEKIQLPTIREVVQRSAREPDKLGLQALLLRRRQMFRSLQATCFQAETTGPLTLHLARASVLENAGICLHPLYGFTYLPGTGLKGMAHAYATQVWIESQPDRQSAWDQIREVFGWAKAPLLKKIARDLDVSNPDGSQAGSVVFHDAWPVDWPRLASDIVNNHHPKYYQATGHGNDHPPGDWENPNPVYFLAVPKGQKFEFTVAPRCGARSSEDADLAKQWLLGALCHLGAGAKTNAGYGGFKPVEGQRPKLASPARREFETTVELITPAFLAGADQEADDCELRPATLRGLLRWWWRTMHAGHVDAATLRTMETLVWGDAEHGGPLRIEVLDAANIVPVPVPGKTIGKDKNNRPRLEDDHGFLSSNGVASKPHNTTQGLFYAAYGTDDMANVSGDRVRRRRFCLRDGARWRIRVTARDGQSVSTTNESGSNNRTVAADEILLQAEAAIWLLCQFGGVGAKSRKGFGSLQMAQSQLDWSAGKVRAIANQFRKIASEVCAKFQSGTTGTAALEDAVCLHVEKPTKWTNVWFTLDQVGAAAQDFAQSSPDTGHGKHCQTKVALGLPRKIHGPLGRPLRHQDPATWKRQESLEGPKGDRHASPVYYHLAKDENGQFMIRTTIFLTDYLWDKRNGENGLRESHATLRKLAVHLDRALTARINEYGNQGGKKVNFGTDTATAAGTRGAQSAQPGTAPGRPTIPKAGDRVTATLLEKRTNRKGGWRAKHGGSNLSGAVVNTAEIPADKKPGDEMEFIVNAANVTTISFRVPGERDKKKPGGKKKPGDKRG